MNGFGVTDARQVDNGNRDAIRLDVDDINRWAMGADPLASLYVFPTLSKRRGDAWTLDATHASSLFVGRGDARSRGQVELRYDRDTPYDDRPARHLTIDAGNVAVSLEGDRRDTRYEIDSMEGEMVVARDDAMLLMATGTGQVSYRSFSTDHLLFKADLNRDVTTRWRYEAESDR